MTKRREEVKRMAFFPTAEFRNQDRAEYIDKQKQRQELQRQQEEAIAAAALKAAEKPPNLQAAENLSKAREDFNRIQVGDPYALESMRNALSGLFDVLDYLLSEKNQQKGGELDGTGDL
jgi:hypothetical protein